MFKGVKAPFQVTTTGKVEGQHSSAEDDIGSNLASSARSLHSKDLLSMLTILRLNSALTAGPMVLTAGVVSVGVAYTTTTAEAAVVHINLSWETAAGAEGYTLYFGNMRPGAATNDLTALTLIGSVIIPNGDATNATCNVGGVGPGSYLGFYATANAGPDVSGPSNIPTLKFNSTNITPFLVTNSAQIAVARSRPVALMAIDGAPPEIYLEIKPAGTFLLQLDVHGLRPGEKYSVERKETLTSPWLGVLTNTASITNDTQSVPFAKTNSSGMFRVKRLP